MAAFDTAITPVASTPANTSNATLFTASDDTAVLVNAANIGTALLTVRIGITPSGGSNYWMVYDADLVVGNPLTSLGPYFLQSGDAVVVRTNTANNAVFSLTGVESS